MLEKIFSFSIRQRIFILLAAAVVSGLGFMAYRNLTIDVFPDPSPPLVQIYTEAQGMAPEEVERLISYPIESSMFGLPRIEKIRSFSTFALSMVSVYFEDGTDIYWARELVSQRLLEVRGQIPEQAHNPVLGPIATGLGMVYLYYLEGDGYSAMELRTLQDWLIKFELKSVPQVSQVLSIGGDIKQYQILIDPQSLLKYGLTLSDIAGRVKKNNQNIGASFITKGKEEYIVRSMGLVKSIQSLENILVSEKEGTPLFLKDVARVEILPALKRGAALVNGKGEKVVGMVLKLFGSNTARVIQDLETRMKEVNRSLPPGVRIVPFYNQAALVKKCFSTVSTSLLIGIGLVILVLFLFMGHISSAVIAVLTLPFSILFSFILMERLDLAADLMSFGGLAIAIGLIADAAIILVENIHRHLSFPGANKRTAIIAAGREVGRPLFFAVTIIILVFLPIFTLTGMEGIMFRPMGLTIAFALAGSLLFTLVVIPALSYTLMPARPKNTSEPFLIRNIRKIYIPVFQYCSRKKTAVFIFTGAVFLAGLLLFPFLGREYIPSLEEGSLHVRAAFDPNISLQETISVASAMEKDLLGIPEVDGVLTRIGRGEVGSHAHFVNEAQMLLDLKPSGKWERFQDKNELIHTVEHRLREYPGVTLNITQPIAHNLDELLTGVKAQLAVKIYGEDFDVLEEKSVQIKALLASLEGAADVQVEQFTGQNHIQIVPDRGRLARYGINLQEVQETIQAAIGGITLGRVYEKQKKFDIFLRFSPKYRSDIQQIGQVLIRIPGGGQIPLAQLAEVEEVIGPRMINRENNKRFITVQCNIRGRDIGSFVAEARKKMNASVNIPPEYFVRWGGQFELQQQANRRLAVITPITLMIVALLLFTIFYSFREVLIILINIPLALTGGIIALKLSGLYLSVPASIGFIAIFGIALEDGLVLLSTFHHRLKEGLSMEDAVLAGVRTKLRPVLMTTFTTVFGIMPLLISTGSGAEIQRPLATVVIGGLVTSTLVTLLVLPLVFQRFRAALS